MPTDAQRRLRLASGCNAELSLSQSPCHSKDRAILVGLHGKVKFPLGWKEFEHYLRHNYDDQELIEKFRHESKSGSLKH